MRLSKLLLATIFILFNIFIVGCNKETAPNLGIKSDTINAPTLFTLLSSQQTNIDFKNTLQEGPNTNILMYEYFYNGGGVATGDLNGDDLIDIYFTSNMS